MKTLTELVKSKGAEFIIVTVLFGGLLYAAITAYQTSVANSHLKEDLNDQKQLFEKNLADYQQTTADALSKQSASVTEIKKALFVVMAQLNVPTEELKRLIGANDAEFKSLLARVIDENPNAQWAYNTLARASFEAGNYDEAVAHLEHLAGDNRHLWAMLLNNLGALYLSGHSENSRNYEEALKYFTEAIEIYESVGAKADAYYLVGKHYLAEGK